MTSETATDEVLYECRDRIAVIRLNRPEKLNAIGHSTMVQLVECMRRFDLDPGADVAILCGNGRAFCSGADVRQRQLAPPDEIRQTIDRAYWEMNDLFTRAVHWKPVICAAHGFVLGMALHFTFSADLLVAAAGTRFQVTEPPRGLSGAHFLALMRFCGGGTLATEAALTGRFFTAEEGAAAGLVARVAPEGQHLEAAIELAAQFTRLPPLGVRATVRSRRWALDQATRDAFLLNSSLKLHLTDDFRESARAFVEKRAAGPFQGR